MGIWYTKKNKRISSRASVEIFWYQMEDKQEEEEKVEKMNRRKEYIQFFNDNEFIKNHIQIFIKLIWIILFYGIFNFYPAHPNC